MDIRLTAKQEEVLRVIRNYYLDNGYAPSLNELKDILGITTKRGVVIHLIALEKKGFIFRTSQPRGIHLVGDDEQISYDYLVGVPILGYANAGLPLVSAEEENLGVLNIDRNIIGKKENLFGLIIKGDSMNLSKIGNEKLENGRYIIVQKNEEYKDGDVVVAIIDNCATVKKFKKGRGMVILYPESSNPTYQPIYLDSNSDSLINGKVIQVLENPSI